MQSGLASLRVVGDEITPVSLTPAAEIILAAVQIAKTVLDYAIQFAQSVLESQGLFHERIVSLLLARQDFYERVVARKDFYFFHERIVPLLLARH